MSDQPLQALLLEEAEQKQRAAADPAVSAWVRANAGTGKTHVLVQRILRLLLSGADPRSILCLTFTKNAAAEMEARVLAKLGEWATADDAALVLHLAKLLARAPGEAELAIARCLFAAVIDAPGGLAIMTIHSFCERILRRYSFEANVPPGFRVLTEEEARHALNEASAKAFAAAASGPLSGALNAVVAYAAQEEFSRVLQAMLGHRNAIRHLLQTLSADDPFREIEARLRLLFGVGPQDTKESLAARSASVLDARTLKEAIAALSEGSANDLKAMARFQAVAEAAGTEEKRPALKAAFATNGGEPRNSLMTSAIKKRAAAVHDRLVTAQEAFLALEEQICGLKLIDASMALLLLTAAIFERYEAEKRARAAVDFDDLIGKALSLLAREDAAEWVLYQLDAQIDHILVDEAQDTSPLQWAILERLTSDFFAGQGARTSAPTLFAVGDEKQSIYGFQGAEPELLAYYGSLYERQACEAGLRWRTVDLNLSFRTLAPVLSAVDGVIGSLPGVRHGEASPHVAFRRDDGGLVELWEPERGEKEDKGTVWGHETARAAEPKPAEALANRIAAQITHWLDSKEGLASCGRPIESGDILILLRKREPMAMLLQSALKREGIPVSGADRIALLDELAVMDLLSLAGALLQSEDDLALAEALKSPFFGFCDEDLFELSFGRETSLWQALELTGQNPGDGKYASAAAKLRAWRGLARSLGPFDFFSHILEAEGGRKAFAARLGPECLDALDELLNLAEASGAQAPVSLADFLFSVRQGASEVKRETDQAAREVRIMTVHGAKGLEANIVILADTCSNRSASATPVFLLGRETGEPPIPIWAIKGTAKLPPVAGEKESLADASRRELGRLLYVAMTRARDRLYIAGSYNGELPSGCWYETIKNALAPVLRPGVDFQGRPVWRSGAYSGLRLMAGLSEMTAATRAPSWIDAAPPVESRLQILSPSRLSSGYDDALPFEGRSVRSPQAAQAEGVLTHKLFEVLPVLAERNRSKAAKAIASAFLSELPGSRQKAAIGSVLQVLSSEYFSGHEGSLTEAGLAVALHGPNGECLAVLLGQADRIHLRETEIDILDYKSGLFSADVGSSSPYLGQLAAYRLALQRLFPAASVHAALIGTRSAVIVRTEDEALDRFLTSFAANFRA